MPTSKTLTTFSWSSRAKARASTRSLLRIFGSSGARRSLDRDGAAELGVDRPINDTEPTRAELAEDPVPVQCRELIDAEHPAAGSRRAGPLRAKVGTGAARNALRRSLAMSLGPKNTAALIQTASSVATRRDADGDVHSEARGRSDRDREHAPSRVRVRRAEPAARHDGRGGDGGTGGDDHDYGVDGRCRRDDRAPARDGLVRRGIYGHDRGVFIHVDRRRNHDGRNEHGRRRRGSGVRGSRGRRRV